MTAIPYVARAGDHQRLRWAGGVTVEMLLDGPATGGALLVMRTRSPYGYAPALHVHGGEDETFVVLEGSATFRVGDRREEVGAGGVAFLPRGLPHTFRITSPAATMLTLCTPGGLEGYFRRVGHDLARPLPAGWDVDPAQLSAALAEYGCTVVGPPPTD